MQSTATESIEVLFTVRFTDLNSMFMLEDFLRVQLGVQGFEQSGVEMYLGDTTRYVYYQAPPGQEAGLIRQFKLAMQSFTGWGFELIDALQFKDGKWSSVVPR